MSFTTQNPSSDPRISTILDLLVKYATGDFSERARLSGKNDEIDAIMLGLNTLADEAQSSRKLTQHFLNRIERLMEGLLKYTMLDFSEPLQVSREGDEIDAIALGLNTLAEELKTAREVEQRQIQTISESKEQIEVILNNAPNAVVVMNEDGRIINWNSKAFEVFGWTFDEVIQKEMHEIIVPERYRQAHLKGLSHFLKTGEGPVLNKLIELSAIRKSGEEFPIELGISAVKSKGKFIFIAFIIDISSRKLGEKKLLEANHNLEVTNKELEAFTYSVSHDLRAPLRAINGYSQLLVERSTDLDEQSRTYIESIAANTKRMGQLIDDLLSLSRYSRAEVVRASVNMNDVADSVIVEMARNTDLRAATIEVKPMPPAMADYNLVVQVYVNLLSNAIKYSSLKESPYIELGAEKIKGETVYYVKDNGSGFDMEFYNKLFGVFQRLHDSTEFEGTGVGLAIVKRIISKHHGRVWAESEIDKGSTFYFTLE
jgi:PAS domain S-box-containing protein